jgi:hypothetical protein
MTSKFSTAGLPASKRQCGSVAADILDDVIRRHLSARRLIRQTGNSLDILDWGRKYLPEYFSQPPSSLHLWIAEQLADACHNRGTKLNILGPRGAAKSTVASLCLPLRLALERWEPYIWIVSDTVRQARAHLESIKAELLENQRLAKDFPLAVGRGPSWNAHTIVLKNGVAIEAIGAGQSVRGKRLRQHRPTLIICDDLQNDYHIRSACRRERSHDWFHGMLMKAGTARTNVVNLATA